MWVCYPLLGVCYGSLFLWMAFLMAEFCRQCSSTLLDLDTTDFAGLCDEGFITIVLCEGCGPTQVDSRGVCVSPDCLEHHGTESSIVKQMRKNQEQAEDEEFAG